VTSPRAAPTITLLRTGVANTASVRVAFERLGCTVELTTDPDRVRTCPRLVLPGVGAFAAGMATLRETGLVEPLRARATADAPLLAVCLGLQLLTHGSSEAPGVAGLGIVDGEVEAFPDTVRRPQMGWNSLRYAAPATEARPDAILAPGAFYFANSFALKQPPPDTTALVGDHGGSFVGAFRRGNLLACQFHPELSGRDGRALLQRWLAATATDSTPAAAEGATE